jgi:hypothetical protein
MSKHVENEIVIQPHFQIYCTLTSKFTALCYSNCPVIHKKLSSHATNWKLLTRGYPNFIIFSYNLVPRVMTSTYKPVNRHTLGARRGKYKGNATFRAKALRLGVNSRQTSRRRTNFPAKELRSKRRISPCIFQIHHYQPFCYIRVTI